MSRFVVSRNHILGFTVAALLLGWSSLAAAEKKRVGVPKFEGAQEAVVRKAVMQVLRGDGYDVVGGGEIASAAKSAGVELDSNDGFKTVAKELSISAFVIGDVQKKKAKLVVRNGADGAVAGEGAFGGANVNKIAADVRDGFSRRLGSAVERGRAPAGAKKPTAAPAPVADTDDGDDSSGGDAKPARTTTASKSNDGDKSDGAGKSGSDEASSAPTGADETVARSAPAPEGGDTGPRAMELSIGMGGYSRNLSFNQDIQHKLRQYSLGLGPVLDLHGIVYPAAFSTGTFVANIGVEGHIQQGFGVNSTTPDGSTFNTTVHDYYGGGRLRFVVGGVHEIAVMAGGGEQAFAFVNGTDSAGMPVGHLADIPDTVYRYGRIGVDARFQVAPGVTLGVNGGYRYIFNRGGQISEGAETPYDPNAPHFFPFLSVGGVDFNGSLAYMVTPSLELRVAVGIKRYFFNMNSTPADQTDPTVKVAGGAVDQYVGGTVGLAYVFGGVPPGATPVSEEPAAEEAAPAKKKSKKKKASDDDDAGGGDEGAANDSDG